MLRKKQKGNFVIQFLLPQDRSITLVDCQYINPHDWRNQKIFLDSLWGETEQAKDNWLVISKALFARHQSLSKVKFDVVAHVDDIADSQQISLLKKLFDF